jgi:hypothetical protein
MTCVAVACFSNLFTTLKTMIIVKMEGDFHGSLQVFDRTEL